MFSKTTFLTKNQVSSPLKTLTCTLLNSSANPVLIKHFIVFPG